MNNWKQVFKSSYMDNATVITEHNGVDVCLRIRRISGEEYNTFVMRPEQALEMAYALLRAQQHLVYDNEHGSEE
jgi:hypothetical protein